MSEPTKPNKQCYSCYEKYTGVDCPKCGSTMHWDLTKCEGRKESGVYVVFNNKDDEKRE